MRCEKQSASGEEISEKRFCTYLKTVLLPLLVDVLSAFDAWNYSRQLVIVRWLAEGKADILALAERKMKRTWFFDDIIEILN